jgi:Ca2+-binding RTX toxin-like protein
MGTVTFSAPINMVTDDFWTGGVLLAGPDEVALAAMGRSSHYIGQFDFTLTGAIAGTLTGFSIQGAGAADLISGSGFAADMGVVASDLAAGDFAAALAVILGAADTLNGSSGADHLISLAGGDLVCADDGDDTVEGGSGNDSLVGGLGRDSLTGDFGRDDIIGGRGSDTVRGGAGGDTLYGWYGSDRVFGGLGDDGLYGNHGNDLLSGGAGDDWLCAGSGHDRLRGGAGRDTFVFRPPEGDSRSTYLDFDLLRDTLVIRQDLAPDGVQRGDFRIAADGSLVLSVEGGNELWFATLTADDIDALMANVRFIVG